jgi:hypothetical protein
MHPGVRLEHCRGGVPCAAATSSAGTSSPASWLKCHRLCELTGTGRSPLHAAITVPAAAAPASRRTSLRFTGNPRIGQGPQQADELGVDLRDLVRVERELAVLSWLEMLAGEDQGKHAQALD